MYKSIAELNAILDELLLNFENECLEFKRAENNFDIDDLGKYFSALGNEANLKNKQYSWIVFGIDDNFNKVKKQISDNTTDNISFIEVYAFVKNDKRVIMFQVPVASGTPINWKGFPYGRNGKAIVPLTLNKIEQIKITAKEKDYIDNKGLDNVYYKDYILTYIEKFWKSNKEEINDLIYPKLPMNMDKKIKTIELGTSFHN